MVSSTFSDTVRSTSCSRTALARYSGRWRGPACGRGGADAASARRTAPCRRRSRAARTSAADGVDAFVDSDSSTFADGFLTQFLQPQRAPQVPEVSAGEALCPRARRTTGAAQARGRTAQRQCQCDVFASVGAVSIRSSLRQRLGASGPRDSVRLRATLGPRRHADKDARDGYRRGFGEKVTAGHHTPRNSVPNLEVVVSDGTGTITAVFAAADASPASSARAIVLDGAGRSRRAPVIYDRLHLVITIARSRTRQGRPDPHRRWGRASGRAATGSVSGQDPT